ASVRSCSLVVKKTGETPRVPGANAGAGTSLRTLRARTPPPRKTVARPLQRPPARATLAAGPCGRSARAVQLPGGYVMAVRHIVLAALALPAAAAGLAPAGGVSKGWFVLFNGKDTDGWKLRAEKVTVTRFLDADGKPIPEARKGKVE